MGMPIENATLNTDMHKTLTRCLAARIFEEIGATMEMGGTAAATPAPLEVRRYGGSPSWALSGHGG